MVGIPHRLAFALQDDGWILAMEQADGWILRQDIMPPNGERDESL
jgi:hypothetical protein